MDLDTPNSTNTTTTDTPTALSLGLSEHENNSNLNAQQHLKEDLYEKQEEVTYHEYEYHRNGNEYQKQKDFEHRLKLNLDQFFSNANNTHNHNRIIQECSSLKSLHEEVISMIVEHHHRQEKDWTYHLKIHIQQYILHPFIEDEHKQILNLVLSSEIQNKQIGYNASLNSHRNSAASLTSFSSSSSIVHAMTCLSIIHLITDYWKNRLQHLSHSISGFETLLSYWNRFENIHIRLTVCKILFNLCQLEEISLEDLDTHPPATTTLYSLTSSIFNIEIKNKNLALFKDEFFFGLCDLIESTRADKYEEDNEVALKLFLSFFQQCQRKIKARILSTNKVLAVLKQRIYSSKTISENLIFLFNRQASDFRTCKLILRFFNAIFKDDLLCDFIYTNDLSVILDIYLREIPNITSTSMLKELLISFTIFIPVALQKNQVAEKKMNHIVNLLDQIASDVNLDYSIQRLATKVLDNISMKEKSSIL